MSPASFIAARAASICAHARLSTYIGPSPESSDCRTTPRTASTSASTRFSIGVIGGYSLGSSASRLIVMVPSVYPTQSLPVQAALPLPLAASARVRRTHSDILTFARLADALNRADSSGVTRARTMAVRRFRAGSAGLGMISSVAQIFLISSRVSAGHARYLCYIDGVGRGSRPTGQQVGGKGNGQ